MEFKNLPSGQRNVFEYDEIVIFASSHLRWENNQHMFYAQNLLVFTNQPVRASMRLSLVIPRYRQITDFANTS